MYNVSQIYKEYDFPFRASTEVFFVSDDEKERSIKCSKNLLSEENQKWYIFHGEERYESESVDEIIEIAKKLLETKS